MADADDPLCDPAALARYVHYHKTGRDVDVDPDPTPLPRKKKAKRKHIPPAVLEARRTIQHCCRDDDLPLALATLRSALRDLTRVEAPALYQLLSLCEGTFAGRAGVHVGTPRGVGKKGGGDGPPAGKGVGESRREGDDDGAGEEAKEGDATRNAVAAAADVATPAATPAAATAAISLKQRLCHAHRMHSLLSSLGIPCTEQCHTALIRLSCRAGDFESAERYLDEAEETPQSKVRLRTYSCLLRAYCGDLSSDYEEDKSGAAEDDGPVTRERLTKALRVWKRMHDRSGGLSTGHPDYKANVDRQKECDWNGKRLFGEGIAPKISLSEREYAALARCATKLKDAPVMERVFGDIADGVLVPGSTTTEVLIDWFRSDVGAGSTQNGPSALDGIVLPPREDESSMGSPTNANGRGWTIHRGCAVDPTTGALTLGASGGCEDDDPAVDKFEARHVSRFRLKPVELTDRAWSVLRDMNRAIVLEGQVEGHVSKFQGGGKGRKRPRDGDGGGGRNPNRNERKKKSYDSNNGNSGSGSGSNDNAGSNIDNNGRKKNGCNGNMESNWRIEAWKKFEAFIDEHPPYHVVVDGANVGYYEQNFANSPKHVDYNQIDWVLRHLLEQPLASSTNGEKQSKQRRHRVVLFLHERHFSRGLAPHWAFQIFSSWEGNEAPYDRLTVYRTPAGMNDDWFWMHAALVNGRKRDRISAAAAASAPTPSVLAVTNDLMRDHHFQMSAQGSFLKWKERHRVSFDFGPWDGATRRREVLLRYPGSYSRRIQRVERGDGGVGDAIIIPMPKIGDEGRFVDGTHVAGEEVPKEETYVVVERVI